jgi:hypothetical protein
MGGVWGRDGSEADAKAGSRVGDARLWPQITSPYKNISPLPGLFIKACGSVLRRKPTATIFAARHAQDQGKGRQ